MNPYTLEERKTLRNAWAIIRKCSPGVREPTDHDLKKLSRSEKAVLKKAKAIREKYRGPGVKDRDMKLREVSVRKSHERGKVP